jgi:hypothetical protein
VSIDTSSKTRFRKGHGIPETADFRINTTPGLGLRYRPDERLPEWLDGEGIESLFARHWRVSMVNE